MAIDVFISYSSKDREWANRLNADLVGRGVATFFDQNSLRDGAGWEQDIRANLLSARHLVCLWSANAHESPWVHRELATFSIRGEPSQPAKGLMLSVNLDGKKNAYGSVQQISFDSLKQAYPAGLEQVPTADWLALIDRLVADVQGMKDTITVPVALFTLNEKQAAQIGAQEQADITDRLGLGAADLKARYGPRRLDWKPFGGAISIESVIASVRAEINEKFKPRTIGWELPDDRFWTDMDTVRAFAARMAGARLGAIIIDPVAVSQNFVQQRLGPFTKCLKYENVVIVALPPTHASKEATAFRRWIGDYAAAILDAYVEPPLDSDTKVLARFGIGLDDAQEIRRLFQMNVGHFVRQGARDAQPVVSFLGN